MEIKPAGTLQNWIDFVDGRKPGDAAKGGIMAGYMDMRANYLAYENCSLEVTGNGEN